MNRKINSESRRVRIELTRSAVTMPSNKRSTTKWQQIVEQLNGLSALSSVSTLVTIHNLCETISCLCIKVFAWSKFCFWFYSICWRFFRFVKFFLWFSWWNWNFLGKIKGFSRNRSLWNWFGWFIVYLTKWCCLENYSIWYCIIGRAKMDWPSPKFTPNS